MHPRLSAAVDQTTGHGNGTVETGARVGTLRT